eukprot:SAG31_NODE_3553_length_4130_cov_2.377822_2_plen_213_part_00
MGGRGNDYAVRRITQAQKQAWLIAACLSARGHLLIFALSLEVHAHFIAECWRKDQRIVWGVCESKKAAAGRVYYYNKQTGESSWEPPPGFQDPEWYLRDKQSKLRVPAQRHSCVQSKCAGGHCRVQGEPFLWICQASGMPHICNIWQCNLFATDSKRVCPVSGSNYYLGNSDGAEAIDGQTTIAREYKDLHPMEELGAIKNTALHSLPAASA